MKYVRATKHMVSEMQWAVARMAKGGPFPAMAFQEQDVADGLVEHLIGRGVNKAIVSEQLDVFLNVSSACEVKSPTEVAEDSEEEPPLPPPPQVLGDDEDLVIVDASSRLVEAEVVQVPSGTYVTSVRTRTRIRCLHKVGACHRVPGVDYFEYDVHGTDFPAASTFDVVCAICFPDFIAEAERGAGSGTESSSSGTSSATSVLG